MNRKMLRLMGSAMILAVGVMGAGFAYAQTAAPGVPTSVAATLSNYNQIGVSWALPATGTSTIVGYYLYRNGEVIANTASLSYTDIVTPGYYTYAVAAYDGDGTASQVSQPTAGISMIADTVPPTAPSNLVPSTPTTSTVVLSWSGSTDNTAVQGYTLYRNGNPLSIPNGLTATTYTDTGLSPNVSLTYYVRAFDSAGNVSDRSNVISLALSYATNTMPSAPSNVVPQSVTTSTITLRWDPAGGSADPATGYTVYRNGAAASSTSGTTYTDVGLTPNASYTYALASYDVFGKLSYQTASTTVMTLGLAATTTPTTTSPIVPPVMSPPASAPTSSATDATISSGVFSPVTTYLYYGLRGAAVKNLQLFLSTQNYLDGANATGFFGLMTQAAVQKFQCAQNIVCTGGPWSTGWGTVGARTRKAINAIIFIPQ